MKLSSSLSSSSLTSLIVPAGAVMPFATNAAANLYPVPFGWLACNGAAVSRSVYSALFSAIGGTYGVGDGSTTFNLPDLRGYFVRGYGTNSDGTASSAGGAKQGDLFRSHNHGGVTAYGHTGTESHDHAHYTGGTTGTDYPDHAHDFTGGTGSGGASYPHHSPAPNLRLFRTGGATARHQHDWGNWSGGRNQAHYHGVQLGISADGGAETRPKNIALLYCIKF